MSNPLGSFIWYELMTSDPEAAATFYRSVVGWTFGANEMPQAGMDYRMIERADGSYAGGVLGLTDEMIGEGAKPGWLGYIHVADVDTAVAAIEADGGQVHMAGTTLEGVGRFALVSDSQGGAFYVMTPQAGGGDADAEGDAFTVDQPQTIRWNELAVPDDNAALAFYTRHFGWTQQGGIPLEPLGEYRFLQLGGVTIGAVMPQADPSRAPGWTFYIGVDDIDRALTAARDGGGVAAQEPMQVPGGEYAVHVQDPHGATFGLIGPRVA